MILLIINLTLLCLIMQINIEKVIIMFFFIMFFIQILNKKYKG